MAGTVVEPATFVERCVRHARELVGDRRVVLAGVQLAGSTRRLKTLRELGAQRCFVVASGVGTGPLPEPDDAESIVVPIDAADMMSEMRAIEALLADPPSEVVSAVDRFDPDGSALLLIATVEAAQRLGDRQAYGPRRAAWVALEDKTVGDALFDAAGVPRPPSRVVPASFTELRAAANALDRGAGTVWAGDAREGFNGGGTYVRWVHGDDDGAGASRFFAAHCDAVRVAPFVDGISCSVHGFATDDGLAVFRPVELINLRRPSGDRLQYAGCATFWDPAPADREQMRDAARRLGEHLRERVDYRGCFTLDGIMGPDGFVATECNPRPGAGIGYTATALPDLPFELVQHLAVAGDAPWLRAAELEATVLEAGDRVRSGGGWTPVTARFETTKSEPLVYERGEFRAAADDEERDATLTIGPGASGGFLRIELDPTRTPNGSSVGPLIAAGFAYADSAHGTGIGPVTPAR
jgi:hypothetical protein